MNIHQGNGEVAMSDTEYGAALKLGKNNIRMQWQRENTRICRCWMMFYPIRILYPQ